MVTLLFLLYVATIDGVGASIVGKQRTVRASRADMRLSLRRVRTQDHDSHVCIEFVHHHKKAIRHTLSLL